MVFGSTPNYNIQRDFALIKAIVKRSQYLMQVLFVCFFQNMEGEEDTDMIMCAVFFTL